MAEKDIKYPPGYKKKEKEIYKAMISAEWIEEEDYYFVELFIDAFSMYQILKKDIKAGKVPMWYTMTNGAVAPHPAIKQMDEAAKKADGYLRQLGFSPASRAKMALDKAEEIDPFMELLKEHENNRIKAVTKNRGEDG